MTAAEKQKKCSSSIGDCCA